MSGIFVPSSGGAGGTVTQGTAAALSGAWPVELTDGTHGPAAVTAANALKVDGSAVTQPASIADGSDVTQGVTTDAAVTSDANGTLSAKLRGLVKILADVWDSGNHWLKVSIQNATLAVTQSGTWTVITNLATGGGKTLLFAVVDVASSGDNTIVGADASNKIKVVSYVIVADAAVVGTWYNGTAGTKLSGGMSLAANGGVSAIGKVDSHLFETSVNKALVLNLGAAIGARGHISYFKEP